jgi:hypothetical protein
MSGIEDVDGIEEALEAMTVAAADYRVTQSRVDRAADRMPRIDPASQAVYVAAALRSGLLGIAAQHRIDCAAESCGTCTAIPGSGCWLAEPAPARWARGLIAA